MEQGIGIGAYLTSLHTYTWYSPETVQLPVITTVAKCRFCLPHLFSFLCSSSALASEVLIFLLRFHAALAPPTILSQGGFGFFFFPFWPHICDLGASQVVLVVKNPPADAGDVRDEDLIPGWERSPGGGHDNPLQ